MLRGWHSICHRRHVTQPVGSLIRIDESMPAKDIPRGVSARSDAPTLADGAGSPISAMGAGNERVGMAGAGGSLPKGRVLVLEDDPAFCGIIRDYLAESGYSVVAVGSGGEGVREVVASDFAMVLCDFMMPGLPGDMFYRAVGKIRPALCQGFIFMTGHHNDVPTNDFIQSVNGFVLRKPFPLSHLDYALALAEVRRTFQSVFDSAPDEPETSRPPQRADSFASSWTPLAKEAATATMRAPTRTPALAVSTTRVDPGVLPVDPPAVTLPASKPKVRLSWKLGGNIPFWGLGFLLLLMAGLWNRYSAARDGVTAATTDRLARQGQWTAVSRNLEKAVALRSKIGSERAQWAHILADRAKPRLSLVLRSLVPSVGEKIEIIEISARGETEESGADEVRIQGVARGPAPRSMADRYRQAVEGELKRNTNGRSGTARFELLEDLPGALPEKAGASFVLTVSPAPMTAGEKETR